MTDKEFIQNRINLTNEETEQYNKELCKKYPFLTYREDYSWTWMDEMPDGWRVAFGIEMCEELKDELIRTNFMNEYQILQIKEKYGSLRWYTGGVPCDSKLHEIVDKYEKMSEKICIVCGKPATCYTTGWISPFCKNCVGNMAHKDI